MSRLVVRHVDDSYPPSFRIVRLSDGKDVGPVEVPSPVGFPVEGMPNSDLMKELRWYLEVYLDYPFPPFTNRAERIRAALEEWGTQAFEALFGSKEAGQLLATAADGEYADLHLEISSDNPSILHWPWESLRDPNAGVLSRMARISRRLNKSPDPHPISDQLPKDRVNILLVTARPYESSESSDVAFRSISRPLVHLIVKEKLPATVTLLRPPTIDQLRKHLKEHPHHYHILHFDGHGCYGKPTPDHNPHTLTLQGKQGQLIFEDANGKPDPQSASVLSEVLREFQIPAIVLNACQSAMADDDADDAFASVAAGLQKSGVRSVVAMAYSLYVSGAQQFLPAFYQRLFETGNAAEATRAGRQQTMLHPQRVCARGTAPLEDWLVPVLFEQQAMELKFADQQDVSDDSPQLLVPAEAIDSNNPYGFIGRDRAVLEIERAMHRPPAGILIYGLGGIGKTTLGKGFVQWLSETNGLGNGCFWFSFQDIRSAEYVINELMGRLFGTNALAASMDQKLTALTKTLNDNAFVIVWDNFEVVHGVSEDAQPGTLSADDQQLLADFLQRLRGGKTKVLITSRSREDWLPDTSCFRLPIRGLMGEERWEFCNAIVRDFGLTVDRTQEDWQQLIDSLEGHPLAMRVILSQLSNSQPGQLKQRLDSNLKQFSGHDAESARLFATLRFVQEGIPENLQPWLIPLSLHERFVDADYLKAMGKNLPEPIADGDGAVDRLMKVLATAGLVTPIGNEMYELHPVLSRFLQHHVEQTEPTDDIDAWSRSFVDFMGSLADDVTPTERGMFHFHGANFGAALFLAEQLSMSQGHAALVQSLAAFALNSHNYSLAAQLYQQLAESRIAAGDWEGEASAYHQIGRIAGERRDFVEAEKWYCKSLSIKVKYDDELSAATTYSQLGRVAQEQQDLKTAEQLFRQSIAIFEKHGDEVSAAKTLHQLARVALDRQDLVTANRWYRKALDIFETVGDELSAAKSYHQLGSIAQERQDFVAAEQLYRKSLTISEKSGEEHGAALTYHQLGINAQERRDFVVAEQLYRKSLNIFEKHGDEHHAATALYQLGRLNFLNENLLVSGEILIRVLRTFQRTSAHHARTAMNALTEVANVCSESEREQLQKLWRDANLGEFPTLSTGAES
ncbi:MAG: tetratricopeptide repeat protein [Planctomycetaceae bacterium]